MVARNAVELDVLILGGGAAGLWILDDLRRDGLNARLLEATALGSGQTIASQGIIHGGMKYSLGGIVGAPGHAIRDMPGRWRRCLAGTDHPRLTRTLVRAECCHLWQTTSLKSRLAMAGARAGLRVRPVTLAADDRPPALAACPGTVARLDEQVIDPASFLHDLAERHRDRLLLIDAGQGLDIEHDASAGIRSVGLRRSGADAALTLVPQIVVLAAGAGNESLCGRLGLDVPGQQRPLHMIMARGVLPVINGHCVDGAATRVTITTACDASGRDVWQVGGQVSEDGVSSPPRSLAARAREEIESVLPEVDLGDVEWSTYHAIRAEPATPAGRRPHSAFARRVGNVIVAWPTKLALVPRLADIVRSLIDLEPGANDDEVSASLADWPRPEVAQPPWETETTWFSDP